MARHKSSKGFNRGSHGVAPEDILLRIHFDTDDLARVRIASGPDIMWEIVLSLQLLQNRDGAAIFDEWRRRLRGRLGPWVRDLVTLAPDASYFPDFLTPAEGSPDLEYGLDRLLSTPRSRLGIELRLLAMDRPLPNWAGRLADGDIETLRHLEREFRAYHRTVIDPAWPVVRTAVERDRARRVRALAEGGCERLLEGFRPLMRWEPPVLEADYPVDRDLVLGGRGLLLIPAYFCWRTPVTLVDAALCPALVYPIEHDPRMTPDRPRRTDERSLTDLLGRTRAAVLRAVQDGASTTELSRRSGTSLASASQHAAVLRAAGLITTSREGGSVLHTLTPLGAAVLSGGGPFPDTEERPKGVLLRS
jgi:DNA-binding transcriptional ArsR family regulator